MSKFAYYSNCVSYYLTIVNNISLIALAALSMKPDLNYVLKDFEELNGLLRAYFVGKDILKIVLALWTIYCAYRINYLFYSFLKATANTDYKTLDGNYDGYTNVNTNDKN